MLDLLHAYILHSRTLNIQHTTYYILHSTYYALPRVTDSWESTCLDRDGERWRERGRGGERESASSQYVSIIIPLHSRQQSHTLSAPRTAYAVCIWQNRAVLHISRLEEKDCCHFSTTSTSGETYFSPGYDRILDLSHIPLSGILSFCGLSNTRYRHLKKLTLVSMFKYE